MLYLFLFVLIGLILGKTKRVDSRHSGIISALIVYVCLPFVNFRTFARNFTPTYLRDSYIYVIAAVIVIAVLHFSGGWLSSKLTEDPYEQKVWQYSLVVPNFSYMGISLVSGVLGEKALIDCMVFGLPFNLYIYA